ncbi:pyruvate kinase [Actinoallomurus sp. CA-150999]|uniref:pyruvate kinase n=1 Tax=Actinoallomurus sp. CA-150999 TaxID=3239887 RepID=UPI003D9192D4
MNGPSITGISLNIATTNEASVATFARSGASYVRFIAKGIAPAIYVSLAQALQDAGKAVRKDFELMIDLPGERPRMGMQFEEFTVYQGMTVLLVDEAASTDALHSSMRVPTVGLLDHRELLRQGDRMLISDGATELRVLEILPTGILAEATRPEALLSPNRSMLLPDTDVRYQALSERDLAMVDAVAASPFRDGKIAVSMVESAEPINRLRQMLPNAVIAAKIETRLGVVNRAEIIDAADYVMLARGDLSLSIGTDLVPAALDQIIERAQERGRDVILATGIFDGVRLQGSPTIADLTDLWYYWRRGIRNFLISGGRPDQHGRQSLQELETALSDFRFAMDNVSEGHRSNRPL